uniref:Uncharacterized protein n=1 Tax=Phlebotomus papatasi TaxID=29031 RepID=A0A1B0DMD8_PHLPP
MFLNRKGYHSLNVMVMCDHLARIMAINGRYGGAAHDSFVWSHSAIRRRLEMEYRNGDVCSLLLGRDSGYPLEPWLLTPYRCAAEGTPEAYFNSVHSSARSCNERCLGQLKGRFRILLLERKSRYSPEKLLKIVNVCSALHNVCKFYNVEDVEPVPIPPQVNIGHENVEQQEVNNILRQQASRIRDQIKGSLWSQRNSR